MDGGTLVRPRHGIQKHRKITISRINAFKNHVELGLKGKFYPHKKSFEGPGLTTYAASGRIPYAEAVRGEYTETRVGASFGPSWATHWFRLRTVVPAEWAGRVVHLLWNSSSEAMVWRDGEPVQGLTGGTGGDKRHAYVLSNCAHGGEEIELYVEMACNGMFGNGDWGIGPNAPDEKKTFELKRADIAVFDTAAWSLYHDYLVVCDMANKLPEASQRGAEALLVANDIVNRVHLDNCSTWPHAAALAKAFLSRTNGTAPHTLYAAGHCHIDTAWLWPYAETIRKAARSWSTQMQLMEQYPGYVFACSQAQQFAWVEEHYPRLFARIREHVAAGSFIPVGGTWVEMDGNLPSGESFHRQFLYGQRYFIKKFGVHSKVFWLPDTFGYSSQLPQIIRSFGMEFFLTQKLSWNQVNKFPHNTFTWKGLDGSRVLTHFPPADTYCAQANVADVLHSEKNNKDVGRTSSSMMLFGHGDGGGGPTPTMLEQLTRLADCEGVPKVRLASPEDFFRECASSSRDLIEWNGELYFEYHRGTYTSQAADKRNNRRSEFTLRNAEYLAVVGNVYAVDYDVLFHGAGYPAAELERLWKLLCVQQFHDVLPGSSIHCVYEDSARAYADVLESGGKLVRQGLAVLHGPPSDAGACVVVVNTHSFARRELVRVAGEWTTPGYACQVVNGATLVHVEVPAFSHVCVPVRDAAHAPAAKKQKREDGDEAEALNVFKDEERGVFVMYNKLVSVEINPHGEVVQVFDRELQRHVIAPRMAGNRFVMYDDVPIYWDAWDTDIYHLEKECALAAPADDAVAIVEEGALRVALSLTRKLSEVSSLRQIISLTAGSKQLTFDTTVEWHEDHKFLKVEFPVDVLAQQAFYSCPYGFNARPTHYNTSWDMARFEVCAHHFADISDASYGVALLNDCKYGYAVANNVLRLSLLKSPKAPDKTCDMGTHRFRYALLPHRTAFPTMDVVHAGIAFNDPLLVHRTAAESTHATRPLVTIRTLHGEAVTILVDAVKRAEDDEDATVVRMYEAIGQRAHVELCFAGEVVMHECNGLEQAQGEEVKRITTNSAEGVFTYVRTKWAPFKVRSFLVRK